MQLLAVCEIFILKCLKVQKMSRRIKRGSKSVPQLAKEYYDFLRKCSTLFFVVIERLKDQNQYDDEVFDGKHVATIRRSTIIRKHSHII